jgi:hypothetical protein
VDVTFEVQVSFGPLKTRWNDGPYEVEADTTVDLELAVPAEAFLHELASSYVSDLRVRVHAIDQNGRETAGRSLPGAYVIWPAGGAGAPVVWSAADLAREAPLGVVDPAVIAAEGEVTRPMRILPPIWHVETDDDVATPDLTRTTVPEDDQTDEEVE